MKTLTAQEIRDATACPNCRAEKGALCVTATGQDMPSLVHRTRKTWAENGWNYIDPDTVTPVSDY